MSILTITPICDYLVGIDWVGYLFQHIGRWFRMYHFESVLFAIKIHYQITFNGVARMKLIIWKCELAKNFLYFHLIRDIIFYVVYFFFIWFFSIHFTHWRLHIHFRYGVMESIANIYVCIRIDVNNFFLFIFDWNAVNWIYSVFYLPRNHFRINCNGVGKR